MAEAYGGVRFSSLSGWSRWQRYVGGSVPRHQRDEARV